MKKDKIEISEFSEGSGTIQSILCQKLEGHIEIFSRNFAKSDIISFISIGKKSVLVRSKLVAAIAYLFIDKTHLKEGIGLWKKHRAEIVGSNKNEEKEE